MIKFLLAILIAGIFSCTSQVNNDIHCKTYYSYLHHDTTGLPIVLLVEPVTADKLKQAQLNYLKNTRKSIDQFQMAYFSIDKSSPSKENNERIARNEKRYGILSSLEREAKQNEMKGKVTAVTFNWKRGNKIVAENLTCYVDDRNNLIVFPWAEDAQINPSSRY